MNLNSCLYECQVMHSRLAPKRHQFVYKVFMFYLDLDELDLISKRLRLVSRNRFNVFNFKDDDHLPVSPKPLREKVSDYLARHQIEFRRGKIMLLTYLRTFGYIFNPVSFYFCFDEKSEPICAIPEVGNTFGEMKPFMMGKETLIDAGIFHHVVPKYFYVSPFMDLDVHFEFKLRVPAERLDIHVNDIQDGKPVLLSSLTGARVPLSDKKLLWFCLKYPLITLQVISLIHWNALLLYLKKIPYHPKAANPSMQRDLHRPHASIAGRTE